MTTFVIDYKTTGVQGFTPIAYLPPANLTYNDWLRAGEVLRRIDRFKNFAIGDWLLAGERKFGEMYSQALDEWGSYSKVTKLVWVARHVPPERRRPGLTWTHHHHVASMTAEQQAYWLDYALTYELSSDELLEEIKADRLEPGNMIVDGETADDDPPYANEAYYAESDRADRIARLVCPHCGKEFSA